MTATTTGPGKGSDKECPDLTCREKGGSGMSDPPSLTGVRSRASVCALFS